MTIEMPKSKESKKPLKTYISDLFKSKTKEKKAKFPRRDPIWMYRNE